jgi:hypothetical protein
VWGKQEVNWIRAGHCQALFLGLAFLVVSFVVAQADRNNGVYANVGGEGHKPYIMFVQDSLMCICDTPGFRSSHQA